MKLTAPIVVAALVATSGAAIAAETIELKPVFARNSKAAIDIEVQHPDQLVCIRKPVINSRTKKETICKTQGDWKVYETDKVEMKRKWNETGKDVMTE